MRKANAAPRKKGSWAGLKPGAANYTPLSPIVFLPRAAEIYPDRVAVINGSVRITYAKWLERARRLASALAKRGVKRGDVVSVMLPNIPSMLDAHYGVPMLGAVLNTINTRLDAETVGYILEHAEAKVFITDPVFAAVTKPALEKSRAKVFLIANEAEYEAFLKTGDPDFQWSLPESEHDPIALNYTSGTTGRPKDVVYHHRGTFLVSCGNVMAWAMPMHPVYLWTLPMFHCNGWCYPWSITAMAGTHVSLRTVDPAQLFPLIVEHKVTHMCGAPTVLTMLITAPAEQRRKFERPVDIMTGGSPPPAKVILSEEAFGHTGMGGSIGFCDPGCGLSFAYVMNQMANDMGLGPTGQSLVDAVYDKLFRYFRSRLHAKY